MSVRVRKMEARRLLRGCGGCDVVEEPDVEGLGRVK
jgi:hypothetical protein